MQSERMGQGMTKLGAFNFLIAQWSFFRLGKEVTKDGEFMRWTVIGPVIPLTGWWSPYIKVGRK